jgi:hypothetical protein
MSGVCREAVGKPGMVFSIAQLCVFDQSCECHLVLCPRPCRTV